MNLYTNNEDVKELVDINFIMIYLFQDLVKNI